jgi:glycosyltransferase involved in cell wall biosynthesis
LAENLDKQVLIFVNHLTFLVSHRLELLTALSARGARVRVVSGLGENLEAEEKAENLIHSLGIDISRLPFHSSDKSLFHSLLGFLRILFIIFKDNPNVVHCISNKPIIFGGLSCIFLKIPFLVSISGIGNIITERQSSYRNRIFFAVYKFLLKRIILNHHCEPIFQNHDDVRCLLDMELCSLGKGSLIKGSGMHIPPDGSYGEKQNLVILPARVIPSKGVREFCEAVVELERANNWEFLVIGSLNYGSYDAWAHELKIQYEERVKFIGHVEGMDAFYKIASIVCLPSYREGFSKSLIEGSGFGCAIVTTDVPGCRDAIIPGETGLMCQVKDSASLKAALQQLIDSPSEIRRLGQNARHMAVSQFKINDVVDKTLQTYCSLLRRVKVI